MSEREGRVGLGIAASGVAGFLVVVLGAALAGRQPDSVARQVVLRALVVLTALGAAGLIEVATRHMAREYRRGWRLISLAMVLVAATHATLIAAMAGAASIWTVVGVVGACGSGLLGLAGLANLGLQTWTKTRLLNLLIDAIITGLSVLVVSWIIAAAHFEAGGEPTTSLVIWGSIGVVLAAVVLLAISQVPRAWLGSLLVMAAAGTLAMVASITAGSTGVSYATSTPYPSLLYVITFGLVGLAPLPGSWDLNRQRSEPWFFQRLIPYFAALGAMVALLVGYLTSGELDEAVLILGGGVGVCLVLRQVIATFDERIHAAELLYQATHDSLTGLPNRTVLQERLRLVLSRPPDADKRHAVLFIDLDDFKSVNDGLSHAIGDALLESAAGRLRSSVRPTDLVARMGGDEFAVLLENATVEDARLVCRRVQARGREVHRIEGQELRLACSIGVGWSDPGDGPDALLRKADAAMYAAKKAGKNAWRSFDADMQAEATERLHLLQDLAEAVATGQLRLDYQPVIDLRSGQVVSLEALLRWYRTGQGWRSIGEVIPHLEGSALVGALDAWALRRACLQLAEWRRAGWATRVAVNVSAREVGDASFPGKLASVLTDTGVQPNWLILEVTESVAYGASESTQQVLQEVRAAGVTVAIDDFGAGYSALQRIHEHRFDALKIDRSFVSDCHSPQGSTLLKAILAMAGSVGAAVVAEGIESEEQARLLAAWGCRYGQGFYFSEPIGPAAAEGRYQRHPEGALKAAGIQGPRLGLFVLDLREHDRLLNVVEDVHRLQDRPRVPLGLFGLRDHLVDRLTERPGHALSVGQVEQLELVEELVDAVHPLAAGVLEPHVLAVTLDAGFDSRVGLFDHRILLRTPSDRNCKKPDFFVKATLE